MTNCPRLRCLEGLFCGRFLASTLIAPIVKTGSKQQIRFMNTEIEGRGAP